MFVKPFLDNPSLVAWGIILLKKCIHRRIHCCREGMHLIGNDVQISCGIQTLLHFYQGSNVCNENTPHTITTPPPACNVDTLHDGCMYSWFSPHPSPPISVKQQEPGFIRPGTVFPFLQCQCFCSLAHCNHRFLFFAERSGTLYSHRLPHPIHVKVG